jgi:hypothetical protein
VVSLNRLRKKCFSRRSVTAAAKAGAENKPVIAAVNRCATQKQAQTRLFHASCKAIPRYETFLGTKPRYENLGTELRFSAACKAMPSYEACHHAGLWAKKGGAPKRAQSVQEENFRSGNYSAAQT